MPFSYQYDKIGSFWLDEIEQYYTTKKNVSYKQFYAEVNPLSQSLPIILHNLNKIVDIILK